MEAINNIIGVLTKWTEEKMPINPELWIESAMKLNVLKEDALSGQIIALQQSLAQKRYDLLLEGKSVAFARVAVERLPEYAECRTLEARVKFIEEHIRLAKKRATMASDDYNSH